MSLALDGINSKIKEHVTAIKVREDHPLVFLANVIPWKALSELVSEDLKKTTTKGFWNVGRKLYVRIHVGIFILQARTKNTDRDIVSEINDNGVYHRCLI